MGDRAHPWIAVFRDFDASGVGEEWVDVDNAKDIPFVSVIAADALGRACDVGFYSWALG